MSESIYKFANGRCPQHEQETIVRITFTEVEDPNYGGIKYEKESCMCALAKEKGCTDQNQCPMYMYAEALT